jgi:3-dehydroquinate synthase
METVHVALGDRSYDIVIGEGLLKTAGERCKELGLGPACLLVTDSNVSPLYGNELIGNLRQSGFRTSIADVPAGEQSKSVEQLGRLWGEAIDAGLDRASFVVALGGGVVGDLSGFVAASVLRGIQMVQVPTSLLAMVDSAVGGKTGINLSQGKNLIGAFLQPALVLTDLEVLQTLPRREFNAGMAEIIKYGVIYDPELFAYIEMHIEAIQAMDVQALTHLIKRSCEIKAAVVEEDEREHGLRAILNYGHTLGHAIEQVTEYGTYLHGEAISIGMVYASLLSETVCGLEPELTRRQRALFEAFDLPVAAAELDWASLRAAMSVDKKAANTVPRYVLAHELGKVGLPLEVADTALNEAWIALS